MKPGSGTLVGAPPSCAEPASGVAAIGSGGNFALAATALYDCEKDAEAIARKAMKIAADICVYTNDQLTVEVIEDAA